MAVLSRTNCVQSIQDIVLRNSQPDEPFVRIATMNEYCTRKRNVRRRWTPSLQKKRITKQDVSTHSTDRPCGHDLPRTPDPQSCASMSGCGSQASQEDHPLRGILLQELRTCNSYGRSFISATTKERIYYGELNFTVCSSLVSCTRHLLEGNPLSRPLERAHCGVCVRRKAFRVEALPKETGACPCSILIRP